MNIAIVLNQPYPNALACTRRIHLYAKGLKEQGNKVKIFLPRATESTTIKNLETSGVYDGVDFCYSSRSTIRSKSFFIRRISDIFSPLKSAYLILKNRPDIILLVSVSFYHILVFKIISLLCSAPLVKERNEVPFMFKDDITPLQLFYLKIESSLCDASMFITKELRSYYSTVISLNKPSCIIPIIAEFKGAEKAQINEGLNNKLVYTGNLLQRKDGILTILEAFKRFLKNHPDYKLFITGVLKKNKDYIKVKQLISEYEIEKHVIFTGYLSKEELTNLISQADILLLAKPLNRQNKYNFPTKVGEYLASKRPVLISNVGEIASYFNDGQDIFMASPDAKEFHQKMEFIIDDYNNANIVAQRGYKKARKEFDYLACSKKMNEFLLKL